MEVDRKISIDRAFYLFYIAVEKVGVSMDVVNSTSTTAAIQWNCSANYLDVYTYSLQISKEIYPHRYCLLSGNF